MLKTAKIVGLNSDTHAALALISQASTGPTKVGERLFLIASCQAEDAFSRVRQALVAAEESFFTSTQTISAKLQTALEVIHQSLEGVEDRQVLLGSTCQDGGTTLYILGQATSLQAVLFRGGKEINLVDLSSPQLVSGLLQPGDRVVLATAGLFSLLNGELKKLYNLPFDVLEDEITGLLPQDKVDPVAIIILEEENENIKEDAVQINKTPVSIPFKLPKLTFSRPSLSLPVILPTFNSRLLMLVGGLLLITIIFGAVIGFQRQKDEQKNSDFEKQLQSAREKFTQAQSLKEQNIQASLENLQSAKKVLAEVLKENPDNQEAVSLQKEIEKSSGDILKIFTLTDVPLWLDMELVKKGFSATEFSLSKEEILVLNGDLETLVAVNAVSKASRILAGPEKISGGSLSSLSGNFAWVFSSEKGLLRVDTKQETVITAVKTDKDWGEIVGVAGFGSNVYLLDKENNEIWKYVPVVDGYTDKKSYFQDGVKVDLSGAKKIRIDSSVWILSEGGGLAKYTYGKEDEFSYKGLDKPVGLVQSFFVSEDTENVYLLDSGNNRLLVLDKKGNYHSQYSYNNLSEFKDIVVDEKNKKVYLLRESKIYVTDLK
ncbi:hypothetical protein C4544_03550 [candidate division WS5 bacterium]|uniref:PPM-type phosphatase domain-containing protein n=1 Tax=candidate division WS5 bacterium TaxID=2093353 RepID=A0A419DDP0_9BACT|nr:MAG: hypothetical protein C4544_03550 [candidate division WS5 bacterium]